MFIATLCIASAYTCAVALYGLAGTFMFKYTRTLGFEPNMPLVAILSIPFLPVGGPLAGLVWLFLKMNERTSKSGCNCGLEYLLVYAAYYWPLAILLYLLEKWFGLDKVLIMPKSRMESITRPERAKSPPLDKASNDFAYVLTPLCETKQDPEKYDLWAREFIVCCEGLEERTYIDHDKQVLRYFRGVCREYLDDQISSISLSVSATRTWHLLY